MDIFDINDLESAAFFTEVGKPLAKAKTVKETLDILMYQVGCIFQPMNWSLLLKEPKTGNLVFTVVVGANKDKLKGVRIPKGEGIAGHILESGESVIVHSVDDDERFSMRMDEATGFKTQSIIGVPLKTDEKTFGVIELINKISGDNFTEVEMHLLSSIAEYAAIAIERSYYNQALKKMALTDVLTGLKNNISLDRMLTNKIEMMKRYNTSSVLLFIDIAGFGQINDQYGYETGDRLLKSFGKLLGASFRSVDEVFRYKGDKFAVIMPQTSLVKAEQGKQRLIKKLATARFLDEKISIDAQMSVRFVDENIRNEINTLTLKLDSKIERKPNSYDMSSPTHSSGDFSNWSDDGEIENKEDPLQLSESLLVHDEADIQDMENNLQPMLDEEGKELQKEKAKGQVKYRYKSVTLSGEYLHVSKTGHGFITVVKLSIRGACFETMRQHNLSAGDILDINFNLDDSRNSLIKRRVCVESVNDKMIEAVFYNPPL